MAKEDDVDGLISDASFVGLPGNESFFTAKAATWSGFDVQTGPGPRAARRPCQTAAQEEPSKLFRLAGQPRTIRTPCASSATCTARPRRQSRISKAEVKIDDEAERTIYTFKIGFQPNEDEVQRRSAKYGKDFQRSPWSWRRCSATPPWPFAGTPTRPTSWLRPLPPRPAKKERNPQVRRRDGRLHLRRRSASCSTSQHIEEASWRSHRQEPDLTFDDDSGEAASR